MARIPNRRRLAIALLSGTLLATMTVATADRALADDVSLEQDGGDPGGGASFGWDPGYDVTFTDPADGWSITDPGTTDIPAVTGTMPPQPPPALAPPTPASCPMNSVPGFLPGDTLQAGHTLRIFDNGVPEDGYYDCTNMPGAGPVLYYLVDGPGGNATGMAVPPED